MRERISQGSRKILVVLPTGGGKSVVSARTMQLASGKGRESIFFASQRELVSQIGNQLARIDIPFRTVMAGVKDEYASFRDHAEARCTLIARDTLWQRAFRRNKMELPPADIVQIDEAHQAGCPTYTKIMQAYGESIIIGFTATPCRTDNKPLGLWFDSMVMGASYSELQALGFLVPVKVIAPHRPNLKGSNYSSRDLQQRMNRDQMVGDIVSEWVTHGQGRSTVLFASGVDHSIHCRDEFRKKGISAEHIDGTMPTEERDDIMQRARDGKITVVCNFGVLHTGVDVPQWKVMICARPTKSFQLWRQMGGRIQRPYPGHDHCLILDHSDNSLVFGYPDEDVDWDIDGDADQGKKHMEAKKREKGEKSSDPYHCEKCRAVYRGYSCPNCGHKPERRGKEIEMSREKLVELERKKLNRNSTPMEKQKHWDDCMGIAINKGLKIGAAAHMYKSKFGVFPKGLQDMPRASQWQMKAKDFYTHVVKPGKVSRDSQQWLEEVAK